MEINKPSPTDVFSSCHEYDLFLLNQEIDTPSDNLNFKSTHVCENEDVIIIHATNLSHTFALPQFMAQHNYEDLKRTDNPSTVPTAIQATSDQTFNPRCAHNPMATQCNQSQYTILSHTFALPQLMAEHNCEDLVPNDAPSTVPTSSQATSEQTFNPRCAHNPMADQCNQSQYPSPNHNFALSQVMAQLNCEDLEPPDTPSAVPTTLKPPVITPSIPNLLIT